MDNEINNIADNVSAYIFRPMTMQDLDCVIEIEKQCFTDPWSKESFESSLKEKAAHLMVMTTNANPKQTVGYCCLYETLGDGDIVNVAIDPEMRKKGLGHRMIFELMRYGRSLNVERFFLEVRESNIAGLKLYEGLGFEVCGMRKNFYSNPTENAVLMTYVCDIRG